MRLSKAADADKAKAEELRELIREAHGLLKDMRAERKSIESLLEGINDKVDARVENRIREHIEELGGATRKAMDNAVAKVSREFDRLEAIFTGTERKSIRAGKPPIEDLIRQRYELGKWQDT